MRRSFIFLLIAIGFTSSAAAHDENADRIIVEKIEQSTSTWTGTPLPDYPDQPAEISLLKITIPPKSRLPWHKHPVINCGYLLEGELHVTAEDGSKLHLRKGDPIMELVDEWHFGENRGDEPAVILVFYAGTKDQPLTILRDKTETSP